MAINNRLFHLGNKIVALRKHIDEVFPHPIGDPYNDRNFLRDTMIELLELINEVRLASQPESIEPERWWGFKVKCTSQDLLEIKEKIELLQLNYELNPLPSELK